MDEEKKNSNPKENAKAAFSEELLSCCACGKIYFSRRPISLLTISRKEFHACFSCSRTMKCSVCGRVSPPESTLVVENRSNSSRAFVCARCRSKVFLSLHNNPRTSTRRLRQSISLLWEEALKLLRLGGRIRFLPTRKKR